MFVDEPDWELTCVGQWDEDWSSYMITWDPEDPTSAFRCWVSKYGIPYIRNEIMTCSRFVAKREWHIVQEIIGK